MVYGLQLKRVDGSATSACKGSGALNQIQAKNILVVDVLFFCFFEFGVKTISSALKLPSAPGADDLLVAVQLALFAEKTSKVFILSSIIL